MASATSETTDERETKIVARGAIAQAERAIQQRVLYALDFAFERRPAERAPKLLERFDAGKLLARLNAHALHRPVGRGIQEADQRAWPAC